MSQGMQRNEVGKELRDSVCLVTGSSRGIGRSIAEALGDRGADVVVNYRSSEAAAGDVVDYVEEGECTALAVQADVTDRQEVAAMRDRVHDEIGPIDVLVNNAGVTADRRFQDMTWEEWRSVLDVCLDGTFTCTKAFYDDLQAAEEGRLINVSSVIGKAGNFGQANYAAAKSGLFGFTRSLALELAPQGATANCVAPGYTDTEMVADVRSDIRDRIRSQIPVERFADASEIAAVVRFLASPEASYVTGEVIDVNGGMDL